MNTARPSLKLMLSSTYGRNVQTKTDQLSRLSTTLSPPGSSLMRPRPCLTRGTRTCDATQPLYGCCCGHTGPKALYIVHFRAALLVHLNHLLQSQKLIISLLEKGTTIGVETSQLKNRQASIVRKTS